MRRARTAQLLRPIAVQLLKKQNITQPPVPVERLAEALGAQVRYLPCEAELSGMLFRDDENVVIGVNSLHHVNRQRFTIAHECGHLLLHKGKDVYIDRSFRINLRGVVSSEAVDPDEIEANRFAAELLMPRRMLLEDLVVGLIDIENEDEIKELASRYRVSVQAMTHRLTNILKLY